MSTWPQVRWPSANPTMVSGVSRRSTVMTSPMFRPSSLSGGGDDDLARGARRLAGEAVGGVGHRGQRLAVGGVAGGIGARRQEGVGLDADEGQVDGRALLVLRVDDGQAHRRGLGHSVCGGDLVDLAQVDDGAGERGVGLGALLERDGVGVHGLEAGHAVVDQAGGEAGDDHDEDGHQGQHEAHQQESGAREEISRQARNMGPPGSAGCGWFGPAAARGVAPIALRRPPSIRFTEEEKDADATSSC